jgi:hypothetical protein
MQHRYCKHLCVLVVAATLVSIPACNSAKGVPQLCSPSACAVAGVAEGFCQEHALDNKNLASLRHAHRVKIVIPILPAAMLQMFNPPSTR